MATTHRFRQRCPSCEAKIPIRDPHLIGLKIDCHKCKYRFEVRWPDDETNPSEGPTTASRGARTSLPARAALFCYRAARGLALFGVTLAGLALILCAVGLLISSCVGIARAPNEAALMALLFALATALAFGAFAIASWVVGRARQLRRRQADQVTAEIPPSDAPAVVRDHFRQELADRGLDPDVACVFVPTGWAASWLSAALRHPHGPGDAIQVLAPLSIPELSRTKRPGRGWCWRGTNASSKATMQRLHFPRPAEDDHPPASAPVPATVPAADRLLAALLGAIAGLVVAPLFALAACAFLARDEADPARTPAALLPSCAFGAAVMCGLFGGARGAYYGGPLGRPLFVQCLLDCSFLHCLGNVGRINKEKLGWFLLALLLSLLCFAWLGLRVQPWISGDGGEIAPSGLHGRTTWDFWREGKVKDWRAELGWWAGVFSYPCCLFLAGLMAVVVLS
jgi:hypothetical protein